MSACSQTQTPTPANISVAHLSVRPGQIQRRDTVTITVILSNTGGTSENYPLVLNINDVKYAEKSITVTDSSIETTCHSATINKAGSYIVVVGELKDSFTVVALTPTHNAECDYYYQTCIRYILEADEYKKLVDLYQDLAGSLMKRKYSPETGASYDRYMYTAQYYMDKADHAQDQARQYYGLYLECRQGN